MTLFDEFTVFENIAIALPATRARGHDPLGQAYADPALVEEAHEILDNVGLADRADDPAKSLPYGARRALEIAVALACRPKLLFLDEPTAGLGSDGRARLADLMRKLKGILTIVIIEHDMEFLFSLADEISVIHWGQVIARGTPAELKANPGSRLPTWGGSTDARRCRHRYLLRRDAGAVRRLAVGARTARCWRCSAPTAPARPRCCARSSGLTRARRGDIRFQGKSIAARATHEIARAGIGWVPDDRRLCPTLTVAKNLSASARSAPPSAPGRWRR